ncbi:ATP-binding protein [Pyrococcus kukulkanii]|uniref:ATPase n=1 Tax=Pyrococcus kukulkanii TaxID=1609559 RepID=A0A127BCM6_9EURY|nr:ATP-binding protein [Pyrococcus kukulkanii]AMM55017.1 ATPase [Pyrococcus kukulkanii]
MFQQFVDRKRELEELEKSWESDKPELIVIYGRRRVGKTALALKAFEDKPVIYFLADEREIDENLKEFRSKIAEFFKDEILARSNLDWIELFKYVGNKGKVVLIIDELPYLVESYKAFPSLLQKAWDLYLQHSKVKLVLIGSSVSMMEKLLGRKSPLYGRRTIQIKLRPLKYFHVKEFFPKYSEEDAIRVYGVVDGIPLYLKQFTDELSFWDNIRYNFLRKESFLYTEAEFLLRQEFREPRRYFSILKAISMGNTKFGEIVNATSLDKSTVSKYLDNLEEIHVVRKLYPAFEPEKRRNLRYEITDNYFKFWFRFIYPNRELIERELEEEALGKIREGFDHYMGGVFEEVARDFLWSKFRFDAGGPWWRKEEEIDFVGVKGNTAYFFEVKWSRLKVSEVHKILESLEEKAEKVNVKAKEKKFGVVAKEFKRKEGLMFDLKDMFNQNLY